MNRAKNQIAETKQVNRTKKAAKKDVKMKESPTMSFGINTATQNDRVGFRLPTMLMKTNGVIGEMGAPAQPQAWRWHAAQKGPLEFLRLSAEAEGTGKSACATGGTATPGCAPG
jgi:hypothetical protein